MKLKRHAHANEGGRHCCADSHEPVAAVEGATPLHIAAKAVGRTDARNSTEQQHNEDDPEVERFFIFHHFINFSGVSSNVIADGINLQRHHTETLKTTYRETVFLMYF